MKPSQVRSLKLAVLATVLVAAPGCRAIGRFGENRQSIAARRLSGQGFQAMHDGRWDIAENLFTDALAVSKSDDRAHWGLAEAYWERGEKEQAIQQIEQAVRLSAGDPRLVQRAGEMYLELGQMEKADLHSNWALQLQRDSEVAWALRGDYLRAIGDDKDALAAYHRALALQPDYPQVQLRAAEIYLAGGRFDRVLATLDRLQDGVGIDETTQRVDMIQGIAMRQLGRNEEALRCFLRAARKDPKDAAPHLQIAALQLARGDGESADRSLAIARKLQPGTLNQDSWFQMVEDDSRLASEAIDIDNTLR